MPNYVLPFPAIDPELVSIGPFALRWYALAYVAGILLGWWYALRLIGRASLWSAPPPLSRRHADDFIVWLTIGIVLGGRLGYVLFYNPAYYSANPLSAFAVWQGGMSFHGGLIGAALAAVLFCRSRAVSLRSMMDLATAAAPFGLFFGRLANFIKPELWGRASDVPWAMVFPGAGPEPRHPSQLYEAALEGLLLFVLLRLLTHRFQALQKPGTVAGAFAALYGLSRIAVEFFREPDAQLGFLAGGLTMGMLLSLPLILLGIYLIGTARGQ